MVAFGALQALCFGDVPRDFRGADDRAVRIADGRDAERDVDPRSVFSEPDSLEMIDAQALREPRHDLRFLEPELGRNEREHRTADDLAGFVAEDSCCAGVPAPDGAVE